MHDLAAALGLVLVIEGVIWAVAPSIAISLFARASELPETTLRAGGAAVVAAGVFLVWLVRG